MFPESDFVMLSALQHFVYCPRQCALIHLEQIWTENVYTAEGRELHDRVDDGKTSYRSGIRVTRSAALRSAVLGVAGVADVVEWHKLPNGEAPFPVEYKRGKPKKHDADKIQLCAQAICLEEMLAISIPAGALFYGEIRHRLDVVFDDVLREKTILAAQGVHDLMQHGVTPPPEPSPKCKLCSLKDECQPEVIAHSRSASLYVKTLLQTLVKEEL